MSEELTPVPADNPGYDIGDPNATGLTVFVIAFVVVLGVIIAATAGYFEWSLNRQEGEAVLAKPSEELAAIRAREQVQLNTYGYMDKGKTQIQIPLDRAMELVVKEAAEGKYKWNTSPAQMKKEEPVAAVVEKK